MRTLALVLICTLAACARTGRIDPATGAPRSIAAEERAVVQAAESLFAAMEARDTSALKDLFLPDARLVIIQPGPTGDARVRTRSAAEFITSLGEPGDRLIERMWAPRVEVGAHVASLWAPYDFHVGETFSHCGIDIFQFVRALDGWKISTLTYTVETDSCAGTPNRAAR